MPIDSLQNSANTQTSSRAPDALLLVAHGSRSIDGVHEMDNLATGLSNAFPNVQVRLGYLELSDPPASQVMNEIVESGATDIVVAPLMLHAGGHSKSDVPAVILDAQHRNTSIQIRYARPLGVDHSLLLLGRRRVEEAGGLGQPISVISRGTSDPDANAEAYRASRLLAEMTESTLVIPGFSGVTWPSAPVALEQLCHLGAERIVAFAWFLATGILIDRLKQDYQNFTKSTGIEVIDAGYLGTGREVVDIVVDRVNEAIAGKVSVNCDACLYRRPFPGLEDRVGMPLGVGHSHLAAEHLESGHSHSPDGHSHSPDGHSHHTHQPQA